MITTYIFDLDDTIIDTKIYARMYHELVTELLNKLDLSEIELQNTITKMKQLSGKQRVDSYELAEKLNAADVYYQVLERYVKHTYHLKNKALPEIFKKIRKARKEIGVVSRSQKKTIELFLDRFRIREYVNFIESGDKSTLLFWISLEKKHELNRKLTLVIDDSEEILEVAKHVGYNVLNAKNIQEMEKFSF